MRDEVKDLYEEAMKLEGRALVFNIKLPLPEILHAEFTWEDENGIEHSIPCIIEKNDK